MFIYFGYFSAGHSIYCIFNKKEIPLELIKLKSIPNYTATTSCIKPTITLPRHTDYRVYNLKTDHDWWWKGDGVKGLILCNPFNLPSNAEIDVHGFLEEYDLDVHDIVNIGEIDDRLRGNTTDPELAHYKGLDTVEEKSDYPDLIIGNNIPKIKLDKEFNYVGKINFQPFPRRDNGTIGQ